MEDSTLTWPGLGEETMEGEFSAVSFPTGTVTFLLTDIEASTRLWEADPAAMTDAVSTHYAVLDEAIARHGGARPQEQGEGDSVVAAFARASDALGAAVDAQRALQAATPTLQVRMAVHTGEAQMRDSQNYVGHTVIRCARVRSCARGGQILVSDVTAALVADRLPEGLALVDLGMHRLRDLSRPERVWQVAHADLPIAFGPLRSLDAFRHNLPAAATSLVGRTRELAELRTLTLDRRLVTVTGSGGVGKTRLAQQVAADLVDEFPDGVCWIELAPVTDPARVVTAVASAAGVTEVPNNPAIDVLMSHFRTARMLLVVDNCEHLVASVAELLQAVLDECPQLHMIATSREPLGVDGETTWRAPSLSLPSLVNGAGTGASELEASDAVLLFVERARQARPNFVLDHGNAATIAQICTRLDGIPLAIELATARVRTLSLDRLAAELDQRFRVLTGGARTVIARQRTLLASVEWSYDLLDEHEGAALRKLSAFVGGFTLDAAEAVCADEQLDRYEVLDVLTRLVDKSLVQLDDELDDRLDRFRLLETIRVYALDRARAAGELTTSRDRHLAWCLGIAADCDLEHALPTAGLVEAVEPEYANLLAALEWSLADKPAVPLLGPLSLLWAARSRFADARHWTDQVLEAVPSDSLDWAQAVAQAAAAFAAAGGPGSEVEQLTTALAIAQRDGDMWATARLQLHAALARATLEPSVENAVQFDHAIELLRTGQDEGGEVHAIAIAAFVAAGAGRTRQADSYLRQLDAHDLREYSHGYVLAQAKGMVCLGTGRYEEGIEIIERSLDSAPPAPRAGLLVLLGQIAYYKDDRECLDRAIASLSRAEELGGWDGLACLLRGERALLHGDAADAITMAEEVHRAGTGGIPSPFLSSCAAMLAAEAGDAETAARLLAEGTPDQPGDSTSDAVSTMAWALIGVARDDAELVERHVFADLEYQRAEGHVPSIITHLEMLACVSDGERAVRLSAAAARAREEIGLRVSMFVVAPRLATVLENARRELGERFEVLWNEGRALDADAAAAYALRMRGERGRPSHGWSSLTPTELTVVDLVAEGLTNPQIATRMLIELSTVKTHVHHVFTKLGVSTRAELAAAAVARRDAS